MASLSLSPRSDSRGSGSTDLRSFELEGQDAGADSLPRIPHLSSDWGGVTAAVVAAPVVVTAGEDLDVVVELRNPPVDALALDPCPVWTGIFSGENNESTSLIGNLPCEEIKQLDPGERIRLRLTVPSPPQVDFSEGGEHPAFTWELNGGYSGPIRTSLAIPMREPS